VTEGHTYWESSSAGMPGRRVTVASPAVSVVASTVDVRASRRDGDLVVTSLGTGVVVRADGLIVTADHETAGMALIGHSKDSKEYVGIDLTAIRKVKASFEVIADELGKNPTPQKIQTVVKEYLGIEITEDEAKMVANDTIRKLDPANYSYPYLHSLAFVLRPYLRVGWGSQTHTASPLYAFGVGPGSERVKGLLHNTQLFEIMKTAME